MSVDAASGRTKVLAKGIGMADFATVTKSYVTYHTLCVIDFGLDNTMRRNFCIASFFTVQTKHARFAFKIRNCQSVLNNVHLIHTL